MADQGRAGDDVDGLDAFSFPIGMGMRRLTKAEQAEVEFDRATKARLLARLDEFDAARNRGAVEARTAWLHR